MTPEETAENIIACWENSDKTYAHLQTLIVRGIKHQRQSARAVADLENETLENRIKELEAIIENGHHRISPVPITEEWLKRFGFEKDNNFTWLTVEMNIQQRVDGFYIWLGSDLKIEHVHQLQNLYFALTGEELTPKQ